MRAAWARRISGMDIHLHITNILYWTGDRRGRMGRIRLMGY